MPSIFVPWPSEPGKTCTTIPLIAGTCHSLAAVFEAALEAEAAALDATEAAVVATSRAT